MDDRDSAPPRGQRRPWSCRPGCANVYLKPTGLRALGGELRDFGLFGAARDALVMDDDEVDHHGDDHDRCQCELANAELKEALAKRVIRTVRESRHCARRSRYTGLSHASTR
jgi:hypothetical protein